MQTAMVKRPTNDTRPRTCITSLQGIILEANRLTTRYAAAGCSSLASLRSHHIPVAPLQIAVPLRCPQFLFTTPTKEIVHRNLEATTARATNHMDLILLDNAPTTVGLVVKLSSLPFHCSKQRKRGGYRTRGIVKVPPPIVICVLGIPCALCLHDPIQGFATRSCVYIDIFFCIQ